MSKDWLEVEATGPRAKKDAAALVLIEAGSPGVMEVEPESKRIGKLESFSKWEDELPLFEEPKTKSASLKAYLKPGQDITPLAAGLKKLNWSFSTSSYKDKDWSVKWKDRIKPVKVSYKGKSVIVKPTWRTIPTKKGGDIIVDIDPGMAFGTGNHATTKMCLRALTVLLLGKDRKDVLPSMLDVGTGTGVLAIAAKKLGVKKAIGTEIDPVAVKIARKNAKLNRAEVAVTGKPFESLRGVHSLVMANILAGDLIRMSKDLYAKTANGGYLVLSGILEEERKKVTAAFIKLGYGHHKDYKGGQWAAIVFRKKAS